MLKEKIQVVYLHFSSLLTTCSVQECKAWHAAVRSEGTSFRQRHEEQTVIYSPVLSLWCWPPLRLLSFLLSLQPEGYSLSLDSVCLHCSWTFNLCCTKFSPISLRQKCFRLTEHKQQKEILTITEHLQSTFVCEIFTLWPPEHLTHTIVAFKNVYIVFYFPII